MTSPHEPAEEELVSQLESILLVAGDPVDRRTLVQAVQRDARSIGRALSALGASLRRGIRLQVHGEEVQLVTAPENVEVVQRFLGAARPAPLSRAALETLSVVAYQQPVTRAEIEATRGVNSDRAVQTLLARGLIEELGERQTLGRPMEFGTSAGFLQYFGMGSLDELPPLPHGVAPDADPTLLGLRPSARTNSEGDQIET